MVIVQALPTLTLVPVEGIILVLAVAPVIIQATAGVVDPDSAATVEAVIIPAMAGVVAMVEAVITRDTVAVGVWGEVRIT